MRSASPLLWAQRQARSALHQAPVVVGCSCMAHPLDAPCHKGDHSHLNLQAIRPRRLRNGRGDDAILWVPSYARATGVGADRRTHFSVSSLSVASAAYVWHIADAPCHKAHHSHLNRINPTTYARNGRDRAHPLGVKACLQPDHVLSPSAPPFIEYGPVGDPARSLDGRVAGADPMVAPATPATPALRGSACNLSSQWLQLLYGAALAARQTRPGAHLRAPPPLGVGIRQSSAETLA